MKINRMLLGMIMILFFPALGSSVLVSSAFARDTFNVDVNLSKGKPSHIKFENETEDSIW
jgi:hypothetical protein